MNKIRSSADVSRAPNTAFAAVFFFTSGNPANCPSSRSPCARERNAFLLNDKWFKFLSELIEKIFIFDTEGNIEYCTNL